MSNKKTYENRNEVGSLIIPITEKEI